MMARGSSMTPEQRARISAATKAAMADPAVRQRIHDGMRRASAVSLLELKSLRAAWLSAGASARKRFLDEILSPVCTASAPNDADGAG
jgi:hypothetical protein